jgi:hypothetical protein
MDYFLNPGGATFQLLDGILVEDELEKNKVRCFIAG